MNEIKVSTENVQKAFHAAGENPAIQELLINLFGKENVEPVQKPKAVTERIKTFEDAYNELGEEHPYCIAFDSIYQNDSVIPSIGDVYSYLKLRIICAALNEGWEPQFTKNEWRWYPWFTLWTEEELSEKSDEWKADRHLISTGDYSGDFAGFICALSADAPSSTATYIGSALCLRNEDLATYCGKQFISLWADLVFKAR